jgi:NADH-quinone oxidoreductase subunit C
LADTDTGTETASDAAADAEAVERDERREEVVALLTEVLGDAVVGSHVTPGRNVWVRVAAEAWADAGRVARDRAGFGFFDFLSAIDWLPSPYGRYEDDSDVDPDQPWPPPVADASDITTGVAGGDTRFQLLAGLARAGTDLRLMLKSDVPDETLTMPTWIGNFGGAAWHERETHEMFGISFEGNPDLRNLYLPGGFEGHPLRKDFPLLARVVKPWPGIVDVEPMPGEGDTADAADDAGDGGDT